VTTPVDNPFANYRSWDSQGSYDSWVKRGSPDTTTPGLDPTQESASAILRDTLTQWGVPELYNDGWGLIKQGLSANAVMLMLADTDAYKKRFAANELRRQKGLAVLTPGEYIAAETSYRTVLRSFGLPTSFYDSADDFNNFLGNDVSPDELNDRAKIASQIWMSNDENTKSTWRDFYGLSDGAAIASILDPAKATPVIERMANAARFGGLARANGLEADKGRLESYSDLGISQDAMGNAFTKIAQTQAADQRIGQRFGQSITQADEEAAKLGLNGGAANKLQNVYRSETALFQSRSAAESGALSRTNGGKV
jgi:hypothetical protein